VQHLSHCCLFVDSDGPETVTDYVLHYKTTSISHGHIVKLPKIILFLSVLSHVGWTTGNAELQKIE